MKTTTVRLFKNLRLEIFTSAFVISQVVLGYIPYGNETARLFKNLRLKVFTSPCVILDVHKVRRKGHSG